MLADNDFKQAMGQFATGVTVMTTRDRNHQLYAITINSFSAVSLKPPLIAFYLKNYAWCHAAFVESPYFAVNILNHQQQNIARTYAVSGGNSWNHGDILSPQQLPLVPDALINIECRLIHHQPAGDHTWFLGEVEWLSPVQMCAPLLYFRSHFLET